MAEDGMRNPLIHPRMGDVVEGRRPGAKYGRTVDVHALHNGWVYVQLPPYTLFDLQRVSLSTWRKQCVRAQAKVVAMWDENVYRRFKA